jgi:tRNA-dihydrouridine synthase
VDSASLNAITARVPKLDRVMIGRGAAANPALIRQLQGGSALKKAELEDFLRRYDEALTQSGIGEHYTLGRLKELWFYLSSLFPGDPKGYKRIRKAQHMADYRSAVSALLNGDGFRSDAVFIS